MALSLVHYRVNEFDFKFNETVKPNTAFQIKPKIECKVAKKDELLFVNLTLKINEDISSPVPFEMRVLLSGTFKSQDGTSLETNDQKAQVNEAFAILYPYLRSTVSSITVNFNIPAYILPTIIPEQLTEKENSEDAINGNVCTEGKNFN